MTSATPVACRHCRKALLLIPYRKHGDWQQAVVCPRCDSLRLMPRGKEPPDEPTERD